MAESLSGSPIGSAPASDFERLLQKQPSEFDRLLAKPLRKVSGPQTDFERLLEKDFKPAHRGTQKPKVKFRRKLGVARGGGGGDDLIALAMVGAELWAWTEELKQAQAEALGFESVREWNKAKEDVEIAAEFSTLAQTVLELTKGELSFPPAKRKKKAKRTVIYGWSRK